MPIELDPKNPGPHPDDPDIEILVDLLEAIWIELCREVTRLDVTNTQPVVAVEPKPNPN